MMRGRGREGETGEAMRIKGERGRRRKVEPCGGGSRPAGGGGEIVRSMASQETCSLERLAGGVQSGPTAFFHSQRTQKPNLSSKLIRRNNQKWNAMRRK